MKGRLYRPVLYQLSPNICVLGVESFPLVVTLGAIPCCNCEQIFLQVFTTQDTFSAPPVEMDSDTPKKPSFSTKLKDLNLTEGNEIQLKVVVGGHPRPEVKWFRDKKDVLQNDRCSIEQDGNTHTLSIKEATLTDEAEYSAIAQNKFGKVTSSSMVTIKPVERKPVFTKRLEDATIVEGFDLVLEVKIEGYPEPKLDFYHNNKAIYNSEKYVITTDKSTGEISLKVCRCESKDHGQYKCTIRNRLGQATCFAKVAVTEPILSPQFTKGLQDAECMEGKDVSLRVDFTGKPKPVITWYRNGEVLKPFGRFRTKTDAGFSTLSLSRAKLNESSAIRCVATNQGGEVETSCVLSVTEEVKQPEFIYSPKNVKVHEKSTASFRATYDGKPKPEVEWFKDEEVISIDSENFDIRNDGMKTTLNVKCCTPSSAGIYKCVASNSAGAASCKASLSIEEALTKPEFAEGLKDAKVKEGEQVCLHAETRGNPTPTVKWYKNEKPLNKSAEIQISSDESNHLLTINESKESQTGIYKIVAKNRIGECSSRAKLTIEQNAEKPVFIKELHDVDLFDSETVQFDVEVIGKPHPKITWYHDSNEIQFSKRCRLEKTQDKQSLIIADICHNDQGTYECIAENIAGRSSCMGFLKIKEPLFAPEFAVPPEDTIMNVGETFTIDFVVIGNPRAEVIVLKDNRNVDDNVKLIMDGVTGEGRLTVSSFTDINSGCYQIIAVNSEGQAEHKFQLRLPTDDNLPAFTKPLADFNVPLGEAAILAVEFTGNVLDVDWYKDEQYITDSEKYEIMDEEYRCTLTVNDCQNEDEGLYKCEIGNDDIHSFSEAHLTVNSHATNIGLKPTKEIHQPLPKEVVEEELVAAYEPRTVESAPHFKEIPSKPEFVMALKDSAGIEGDDVTLQVTVQGFPLPEVTWFKGPQQIRKSSRITTQKESDEVRSLVIRDVNHGDAGEYKCVATNKLGSVFSKSILNVSKALTKPKFIKKPKDLNLIEGDTAILVFSVIGNPSPTVVCQFKGENNNMKDVSDLVTLGAHSKLVLPNCNKANSGVYTFIAKNEVGEENFDVSVEISSHEVKPKFVKSLGNTKLNLGKDLKLRASCQGDPKSEILWKKDGKELAMEERISQIVSGDVLTLTVCKCQENDAGIYSCMVKNKLGSDTTTCTVEITRSSTRPAFRKKLKDATVVEGSKITLSAEVEGHPEPTLKWTRDGHVLRDGGRISIEKAGNICLLTIDTAVLGDKGMYCCAAKNSTAEVRTSCIVFITKNAKSKPTFMKARAAFENKAANDAAKQPPNFKIKSPPMSPPISPPMSPPAEKNQSFRFARSVASDKNSVAGQRSKFDTKQDEKKPVEQKPKNEEIIEPQIEMKVESEVHAILPTDNERKKETSLSHPLLKSSVQSPVSSKFSQPPSFIRALEDSICSENIPKTLMVMVRGSPDPAVQWFHDENRIAKDKDFDIIEDKKRGEHKLRIKSFSSATAGKYTAEASNDAGTCKCEASLKLKEHTEKPRFTKKLLDQTIEDGHKVVLETDVQGMPLPTVQWFKNDRLISKSDRIMIEVDGESHKLTIEAAEKNDLGVYSCAAKNSTGEAKQSMNLKMKSSGKGLEFTKSLKDMDIYEGKEALLQVIVDGELPVNCKWEKDGKPVRNTLSTRFEKKDNVCSLKIGKPTRLESGKYAAIVTNSSDSITSTCNVKVLQAPVKPSFILKLRDVTVFEGKDVEISAKVNGKPEPEVRWYLKGEEIENGGRYNIVKRPDGRQILKITGLAVDDNGELKCAATNPGGSAVCSAKIAVRGSSRSSATTVTLPKFTRQLGDCTLSEDDALELKIETAGSPTVTWFKDSKQMIKSTRIQISSHEDAHSLKIAKVRSDDAGMYKAVAKTRAGEKSCHCVVAINKKATLPVIKRELSKVKVKEGDTATFKIVIEGSGVAIEWLKDGTLVKPAKNVLMRETRHDFELQLKDAEVNDSGLYEFVAKNAAGSVSSSAELIVSEIELAPKFVKKLQNADINENVPLEFVVEVAGKPKPTVKFLKDGKDLHVGTVTEEKEGVWKLEIPTASLSDSGSYVCEATNRLSTVRCSANVNVKRLLTPPRFSTLTDESNEVFEDEELRLEVLAIGEPQPEVQWLKRSRRLKSTDNVQITDGELSSLVLHHTRMEDAGEYRCVAKNKAGQCDKTFFVVVKGKRFQLSFHFDP